MSKPSDSKSKSRATGVDRRRLFLMGEAAADESQAERVKARYKETDHVKNYYRVNRY
jgi:hypothetical protein